MQGMKERDDRQPLSAIIEFDDALWGGERQGGKRGWGAPEKVPFIAAVRAPPMSRRLLNKAEAWG
jgi:hypothetical protein